MKIQAVQELVHGNNKKCKIIFWIIAGVSLTLLLAGSTVLAYYEIAGLEHTGPVDDVGRALTIAGAGAGIATTICAIPSFRYKDEDGSSKKRQTTLYILWCVVYIVLLVGLALSLIYSEAEHYVFHLTAFLPMSVLIIAPFIIFSMNLNNKRDEELSRVSTALKKYENKQEAEVEAKEKLYALFGDRKGEEILARLLKENRKHIHDIVEPLCDDEKSERPLTETNNNTSIEKGVCEDDVEPSRVCADDVESSHLSASSIWPGKYKLLPHIKKTGSIETDQTTTVTTPGETKQGEPSISLASTKTPEPARTTSTRNPEPESTTPSSSSSESDDDRYTWVDESLPSISNPAGTPTLVHINQTPRTGDFVTTWADSCGGLLADAITTPDPRTTQGYSDASEPSLEPSV